MHVLALDIGTSSVKSAVLDVSGRLVVGTIRRVGYELHHPTPEAVEIRPDELWAAFVAAAREAVAHSPVPATAIEGVGISCLTPGLVLLDGADRPLGPIWIHADRRSRPAARQVWAEVGDEFLHTVGNRPLPGGLTALCYRQQTAEDPGLAERVRSYLHINGWLALGLTGERAFDPSNASFSGLFGTLTDQQWSPRWCDYFGVRPGVLPPVISGETTVGRLRPDAAAELGVAAGLPVKMGIADTSSAMLAVEMTADDIMHVVGTTQVLAVYTDRPTPSPARLTRMTGIGRQFVYVAHNPVGGGALEWLRELCFRDQTGDEFYTLTVFEAATRATPVRLDPPFLGGDRLQIEPAHAAFRELTLTTDRMDLLAAVLAQLVHQHGEALKTLDHPGPFARIFLTGGGAEVVRKIIPAYGDAHVIPFEEGSLKGVAHLFAMQ